jgi:4,5-DOPA dioxygenase extradiol
MKRPPVLFISHGAPTFALEPGDAGAMLAELGQTMPVPTAILVVSPHWMHNKVLVSTVEKPATIHDFRGFPAPLYQLQYPAPGSPSIAALALQHLRDAHINAEADNTWGLDHGAWVPLMHLLPAANIPVLQVAMPWPTTAVQALQLGEALAGLREHNVLIIGSGSLTHNLSEIGRYGPAEEPYVVQFVQWVRNTLHSNNRAELQHIMEKAPFAQRAHPSPDHLWPLLVAAGAAGKTLVRELRAATRLGVLSMESYVFEDAKTPYPV